MCNYNIWFDGFRCVLCGACADVCPEGVIHMIDVNQMKSEGALPELVDGYGWTQGAAMVLDAEFGIDVLQGGAGTSTRPCVGARRPRTRARP
mgnify:CR=1 FL=1